MPIQSYLMMYFAGSGWQYGKRKISAMSNEQFNKLTPEELLKQHSIELKNMLPTLEKSLNDVTPLVRILIEQYGDFIREALQAIGPAIENLFKQTSVEQSQFGITQVRGVVPDRTYGTTGQKELDRQIQELVKSFGYTPGSQTQLGPGYKSPVKQQSISNLPISDFERAKLFGQQPKAQLSIAEQQPTFTKRKAGQSQILERKSLLAQVTKWYLLVKQYPKSRTYLAKFKEVQQLMVNLLARYQF